jgi:GT2 family glycosyltransferase
MFESHLSPIGVVICTFQSEDVIVQCLESLIRSEGISLKVTICENASTDQTVAVIHRWAAGHGIPLTEVHGTDLTVPAEGAGFVTLIHSGGNLGYAGAINRGLAYLRSDPTVDLFWILNPDSVAAPDAALAYATKAATLESFGLMGGRTIYHEEPRLIQSDGGTVSPFTGRCVNINQGRTQDVAPPDESSLDFISGANVVASRAFIEQVGLMEERYFLYYEEVDWAAQRGPLSLKLCPEAKVFHHGGTTIGTGSVVRRATGFANYFNYRNRMWFMTRFHPWAAPIAWGYSMLKICKLVLLGGWSEAVGAFRGLNYLPPPEEVRRRVSPDAFTRAFGDKPRT